MGVAVPAAHPPLAGQVPATAFLTALARAGATAVPDGALHDPYADRFARLCPDSVRRITRHTVGLPVVVARTLAVDRLLSDLFAAEPWEVCVNLGAGFDARTHRLDWPGTCRVIEIDCAPVIGLKDRLLPAATASVPMERLCCDLRDLTALARLLRPRTAGRRTLLLAEGLLGYLTPSEVRLLCAELAWAVGAEGGWICDVLSDTSARALTAASRAAGTSLPMYGLTDLGPFETAGWRCERLELLPTAQPSTRPGATGRQLPDSVLQLRRSRPADPPAA
ncbi:class I SAM-dependent methyltransferase [Kitasatospora sp. NPDC088346]|uniref:class I SAM-dependent methyltransferase n=1 Tax=Kitasatospora sp. NPDC088346 TaxID=3364073 RepID=UPI00380A649E